jgi:hypothetical protein
MLEAQRLYPVNRTHLEAISDEIGIFQHAQGSRPDPAHGYCTDDVSRALQVDLLHARELGWAAISDSAWRHLHFLTEAFDAPSGRFRNFRTVERAWVDGLGSEDCQGRALHALGDALASGFEPEFSAAAAALFERALPLGTDLRALRAIASVTLGCDAAIRGGLRGPAVRALRPLADRLASAFDPRHGTTWPWPEPRLTYENGLIVRALIVAGRHRGSPRMVEIGVSVLDWLVANQTASDGHLTPIGNGWWAPGVPRSRFDQQPIEPTALLLAAEAAWLATGEPRHRDVMARAYGWFLGQNDLGIAVADPDRGACHDGLTASGVNLNQGAESTLMWLTAVEHVRAMRRGSVAGVAAGVAGEAAAMAGSVGRVAVPVGAGAKIR